MSVMYKLNLHITICIEVNKMIIEHNTSCGPYVIAFHSNPNETKNECRFRLNRSFTPCVLCHCCCRTEREKEEGACEQATGSAACELQYMYMHGGHYQGSIQWGGGGGGGGQGEAPALK